MYTISIADLEGDALENATVYLVDNTTGMVTNLSQEAYSFNSSMGTFNNRFTLQFEEEGVLGTLEVSANSFILYPNPAQESVNITSVNGIEISEVHIYDLQGRKLISKTKQTQNGVVHIDVSMLRSATYLMQIKTQNGMVTKQLIKE